jgi:hypothetical protein
MMPRGIEVPPALLFLFMASGQPPRQYCVVSSGSGWEVVADHNYLGTYRAKGDALRQAIDWAQIDGASGFDREVLIQDQDVEFKVAWTYGRDAYPSNG